MKKIAVLLTALVGAMLASSESSTADQFSFRQCSGAESIGLSGFYSALGDDYVDVVTGCNGGPSGKLGVYQDRSNRRMSFGSGGQFIWYVPAGDEITETSITLNEVIQDTAGVWTERRSSLQELEDEESKQ